MLSITNIDFFYFKNFFSNIYAVSDSCDCLLFYSTLIFTLINVWQDNFFYISFESIFLF